MTTNFPSTNFYTLEDLDVNLKKQIIDFNIKVLDNLNASTLTTIRNAFSRAMRVYPNGACFIHIVELANLLRTGTGAHSVLWQHGLEGYVSPSQQYNIGDDIYISGPDFCSLLDARLMVTSGTNNLYLKYVRSIYQAITSSSQIANLRTIFVENINSRRSNLKRERISAYSIKECEFSGEAIQNLDEVVFAHIESVATSPLRALDIRNGVIILKEIHDELTNLQIHDFAGMYDFCKSRNLNTSWAYDCEP
jgi:hypothetical protein